MFALKITLNLFFTVCLEDWLIYSPIKALLARFCKYFLKFCAVHGAGDTNNLIIIVELSKYEVRSGKRGPAVLT